MILILDNFDSFTFNLKQSLSLHTEVCVFANNGITIEEIVNLNPMGIVLSPGPKDPDQAGMTLEVIHHFHQKIPILGVCLGHQALAQYFGASIIELPVPCHGKQVKVRHNGNQLFQSIPNEFYAARYHSLHVSKETLPKELSLEASSQGVIMALAHKKLPLFGVQFHPESFLCPFGDQILENFIKICNTL